MKQPFSIQIITLFPEMFAGVFDHSMLYKAQNKDLLKINIIHLRDFGLGPRKQVDDTPYGGGDGMVLKPEPIAAAIVQAKQNCPDATVILTAARGERFRQPRAQKLAKASGLIIICGRYEGVDERVLSLVDLELSIGDFVLTGGELPAMVITDAVSRLIPGVLGGESSAEIESFTDGKTLEYPQYTRPEVWQGQPVPRVLLSGNHKQIEDWRNEQSARKTTERSNLEHRL
jgi:tRNA (guanine37-N1)-methyltransferase